MPIELACLATCSSCSISCDLKFASRVEFIRAIAGVPALAPFWRSTVFYGTLDSRRRHVALARFCCSLRKARISILPLRVNTTLPDLLLTTAFALNSRRRRGHCEAEQAALVSLFSTLYLSRFLNPEFMRGGQLVVDVNSTDASTSQKKLVISSKHWRFLCAQCEAR